VGGTTGAEAELGTSTEAFLLDRLGGVVTRASRAWDEGHLAR